MTPGPVSAKFEGKQQQDLVYVSNPLSTKLSLNFLGKHSVACPGGGAGCRCGSLCAVLGLALLGIGFHSTTWTVLHADTMVSPLSNKTASLLNNFPTSSIALADQEEPARLPIAVLHVGPHKTGTTTLQEELQRLASDLKKDGFAVPSPQDTPGHYEGRKAVANLVYSIEGRKGFGNESMIKFLDFLDHEKEANRSIVLSSEGFDRVNVRKVAWLFSPWFRVRIILVYRRLYEWLSSVYFQIHRTQSDPFVSFVTWLRNFNMTPAWKHRIQPSAVFERYKSVFDDITVLNYHDDGELAVTFFCRGVVNAKNTCQKVKARKSHVRVNQGKSLEYERLIRVAQSKSVVDGSVDLKLAVRKIRSFHQRQLNMTFTDLPMDCLEDNLAEVLFQNSMNEEKILMPEWFHAQGGQTAMQTAFDSFRASKLCSLNCTAIIEDATWVRFLRQLNVKKDLSGVSIFHDMDVV